MCNPRLDYSKGYNNIANSCRSEEAEAYKFNGKEYEDALGLNMYEYGARNYDPAVGRFFNIDNYAEKFSDVTPYQYAGNTPTYFIDENGEYIYVYDKGIKYKFDNGTLYAPAEDGGWEEHTPAAGSFLDSVFTELKSMYEFSTGGSGGGNGEAGNSFSSWFIGLFNNDNINAYIKQESSKAKMKGAFEQNGFVYLDFETIEKRAKAYTTNAKFEQIDLFLVIAHELAHALSYNLINEKVRKAEWFKVPGQTIIIDEFFAVGIENYFRAERQSTPIRTHYLGKGFDDTTFQKSRIYDQNKNTGQFEMTTQALNIFNNYKKSLQHKGIQWKD